MINIDPKIRIILLTALAIGSIFLGGALVLGGTVLVFNITAIIPWKVSIWSILVGLGGALIGLGSSIGLEYLEW